MNAVETFQDNKTQPDPSTGFSLLDKFASVKTAALVLAFGGMIAMTSCARGITPGEAANGKAKCGRYLR